MRQGWRGLSLPTVPIGRLHRPATVLAGALVLSLVAGGVGAGAAVATGRVLLAAGSNALAPSAGQTPVPQAQTAAPSASGSSHSPITYGSWGAGYVADAPAGETFTAVSARFIAPPTSAAPHTPGGGWVSIWGGIGLQALNGDQLMQAGISMYANPAGYWEVTAPWWINEPVAPTVPHVLGITVNPGDTVEMDAGRIDASHWGFRVTDLTTNATATGECSGCASDGQTAAWIMEDPLSGAGAGQTGFANPGPVTFTNAAASLDSGPLTPLPQLDWHPLTRHGATTTQAPQNPGGPGANGAFVVG